jgi:hypothetical protein
VSRAGVAGALGLVIASGVGLALLGPQGCTRTGAAGNSTPAPAPVFPGSAKLAEVSTLAEKDQLAGAADALAEAQRLLEEAAPLRIRNLTVVESAAQGFGLYTAKGGAALGPGEPLILYFEPNGFARTSTNGTWTMELVADVNLYSPPESVPFVAQQGFVELKLTSRAPNREIFMSATLHLKGVPPGDYAAQIVLTDTVGKETAKANVPFTLK